MKSDRVDTWTGRYGVTDGDTTFRSVHGKGKKALRESRAKAFDELINATQIINCSLSFKTKHANLEAGSKVALYPSTGKIAFRSTLEGCDPDAFIKTMAR